MGEMLLMSGGDLESGLVAAAPSRYRKRSASVLLPLMIGDVADDVMAIVLPGAL